MKEINKTLFIDVRSIFFAELNAGGIDVKNDELSFEERTCLSGFLSASTEEVGIPTNPAPKQTTLKAYIC